jgi:phage-related protein
MPSVVDSLGNLIAGIFNTITAALGSIIAVFQSLINTILGVIGTAFAAVGTMISGLAQTFEGLIKFFLSKYRAKECVRVSVANAFIGNILVIGAIVGGLFIYGVYQQRNATGKSATTKKLN